MCGYPPEIFMDSNKKDDIDDIDYDDVEEVADSNLPTGCSWLGSEWFPPDIFHPAPEEKKCTCGAEATYGPDTTHMDWCDKLR